MKCIICGERIFIPHHAGLLQCTKCKLVVAQEAWEEIDPKKLYDREYFFGFEYHDYIQERKSLEHGFKDRLQRIIKYRQKGQLLEIGCAYGFFLQCASKHFDVQGIDISQDAIDYARRKFNISVRRGDFLCMKFRTSSFDVICMWDTIEHLQRPDLYVRKIASLLRPGGILCVTTGNIDQLLPRIQRARWRLIHPPTHLYYFSSKTLSKLFEKYNLYPAEETYPGFQRSIIHILHGFGMKSSLFASLYKKARHVSFFRSLTISYNPFDIMYIIAQKQ